MPHHPITGSSTPSPEVVRQELQAILSGRPFATAVRARRFLTHIVEETLAGRTDGIKELVLGIEVFDRPADFDPKTDTIVRVEAGRLRKRLEEYYADEGAAAAFGSRSLRAVTYPSSSFAPRPPPWKSYPRLKQRRWYGAGIFAMLLVVAGAWGGLAISRARTQ